MPKSKKLVIAGGFLLIIVLIIYGSIDPALNGFFPKCPFLSLTGYQCPGCGSQRAIHQLLHGNLATAFQFNPLLVLFLPYIFIGALFEFTSLKHKFLRTQRWLFGYKTMYLILAIIILFWVGRNFW